MPKITINEVDLTKASLQPSSTDIAFVPGLSCLPNATEDFMFCETIADFEKNFGTYPAIIDVYRVYNDNTTGAVSKEKYAIYNNEAFESNFYNEIYKNSIYKKVSKYSGTLSGTTQLVLGFADGTDEADITKYLNDCGLISADPTFDSTNKKTVYLDFEYDMSYVYAKELLMMGIPVVYKVCGSKSNINVVDNFVAEGGEETYTTKYTVKSVTSVKVNDVALTEDEGDTPAAGKYIVSGSVITFGTQLTEDDELEVDYSTEVFGESYQEMLAEVNSLFTSGSEYYNDLLDKGEFSIKYVTSGSYPSFGYKVSSTDPKYTDASITYFAKMANVAYTRGDCVALIDPADCTSTDANRNLAVEQMINPDNIYEAAETLCGGMANAEYASLFVPWIMYTNQASYMLKNGSNTVVLPQLDSVIMPPSFAYLVTLAKSIRMNSNWLAVAGVARGQVPYIGGLYTTKRLSNTLANFYQPRNGKTSINAITDIKPYGLTIWGNRTMKNNLVTAMGGEDGLTATSFLNIRNMVSDVKKTAYVAAKTLMFEQNSDILWINFLSRVTPFLDELMYGQGLSDYKVIQNQTKEKAKLSATIKLYPLYAVEDFDITIELSDEDVSVV